MNYRDLSTPALMVDLNVLERNLDRMADYCRQHALGLRPHTKTHKTPEVARMQLDRGACGLTVAKLGEAEVMAASADAELLLAYPIIGDEKLSRLATLAKTTRLLVALDSEVTARNISQAACAQEATVGVLVEFDVGFGRCGLSLESACVELAQKIQQMPGLKFRGLTSYAGNIWGNEAERQNATIQVAEKVEKVSRAFAAARLPVEIVSGGSTPGAFLSHQVPGLTEIRPGTYAYNDLNTYYQGACQLEDCAVRIATTVVSTAIAGRAIIDAGSKTLSSDTLSSGAQSGYGYVVEAPDTNIIKLNEEHGYLDTTTTEHQFRVGEVVTVIPNHVCTCVNMHDDVVTIRDGEVVGSWRVAARGKIR